MEVAISTSRTERREPTRNIEQLARDVLGRERLTIVTGDEGTGKTTLCLALAERFGARTWGSLVLVPPADTAALLDTILVDLGGIAPERVPEQEERQLAALLDYLRHAIGTAAAVVVDSAHDMSADMFATLVRAARDAARVGIMLQLVLVGLPSLDERLSHPDVLDAVRDLGTRREHLEPLAEADIKSFMERRWWRACGGIDALAVAPPRLNWAAAHLAFCASAGNPRTVAAIADRLRLDPHVMKHGRISAATMQRVVAELGFPLSARPWSRAWAWATVGAAVLAFAGILAGAPHTNGSSADVPPRREAAGGATLPPRSISTPSPAPITSLPLIEDLGTFRRRTLDAAARLSRAADVRGMMRLEDEAKQWDVATKYANHATVAELLAKLEQLTNDARARQLADDGRQLRESRSPQTP